MKKLLLVLLALLMVGCTTVEDCMAVEFVFTGDDISWGEVSAINDLYNQPMSISFWFYPHSFWSTAGSPTVGWWLNNGYNPASTTEGFGIYTADTNDNLFFNVGFSDTEGTWNTPASSLSKNVWQSIIITYDGSNGTSENPVVYIGGTSVAINEATAPIGNIGDAATAPFRTGRYGGSLGTGDGLAQDIRFYNRILTAQEASIIANSRCQKVVLGGLVFWAPFMGAAGAQSFDGQTLSASNTLLDVIGGVQGTPSGSPIGRGSTIQVIGGHH